MDVGAVGALGVERLHDAGADDLHRGGHRRQVAVGLLLLHLAHPDPAPRHQRLVRHRPAGRGDHPREVLERADLEGHGHVVTEGHRVGTVAQHAPAEVGHAHEDAALALLLEPLQVAEVVRPGLPDAVQQRGQRARLLRLAIDLVRRAVAGHDGQQVVDDPRIRVQQERVEIVQPAAGDRQAIPEIHGRARGCRRDHGRLLVCVWRVAGGRAQSSSASSSSYSSSFMPNQFAGAGKVRSVTSPT